MTGLDLTDKEIEEIYSSDDPELKALQEALHVYCRHPYYAFEPRPDNPNEFDEQSAFCEPGYQFDPLAGRYVYDEPRHSFKICLGGNGCLRASQPVHVHGRGMIPVGEIHEPFLTLSWNGRRTCFALANAPFVKGVADVYRVVLSNGREFHATASHRILAASGCWESVRRAFSEQVVLRNAADELECHDSASDLIHALDHTSGLWQSQPETSVLQRATCEALRRPANQSGASDDSLPSPYWPVQWHGDLHPSTWKSGLLSLRRGEPRLFQTRPDSREHCFRDCRPCDARLQSKPEVCRSLFQQPTDARERSRWNWRWGGPARGPARSPTCRECDRLSMTCFSPRMAAQSVAFGSGVFYTPSRRAWESVRVLPQFQLPRIHASRTTFSFAPLATESRSTLPWPTSQEPLTVKIVAMERVGREPFYDFTVHGTHCYVAAGVVHHNSGKTAAAAHKTARHVLETPPPEEGCKFWVVAATKEQVGKVCWHEKLREIIPANEIAFYDWDNAKRQWPAAVGLKHPDDYTKLGWVLEFKSYEQGLASFTSASIGGYWLNEEVPFHLVAEIQSRLRDYDSPGWADFTPIECRDPEWPERYEKPPQGWRFYHLNSKLNFYNPPDWYEYARAGWPDDMVELRTIGKFTALQGAVFKEFRRHIHVIDWDQFYALTGKRFIPREWHKARGIDFGYNNPFCCLWGARDRDGIWFIYDEHYKSQTCLADHAAAINKREWDDSQPWFGNTYADHDSQDMAELARLGIHCTPARKSNKNAAIDYVRSLMLQMPNGRPKIYILADCKNLIREVVGWRWKQGTAANRRSSAANPRSALDEPMDIDDHACDSLLYLLFSDKQQYSARGASGFKKRPNYGRHGVPITRAE